MAIAAVAVSIFSVVGVLASQAYYRSVISDAFGISEDETRQRPTAITSESHASPSGNSSETDAGTAARACLPNRLGVGCLTGVVSRFQIFTDEQWARV
ncbi:hypothetical protein, partial [Pseudarthrobacter oxydans]|uniref:hypothetical protein n=1 Tax=Pseudarthrobacter oxydans TaxID=1671 RepID=UPI00344E06C2